VKGSILIALGVTVAIGACGCRSDAPPAQPAGSAAAAGSQPVAAALPKGRANTSIPSQVLDLSRWKLTLPVDSDRPGTPDEIRQGDLAGFVMRPYFHADSTRGAVVLRAPCGGATTKGSRYPRCELREMNDDGRTPAAWDTEDATVRVLTMRAAVTATPSVKPHVVVAQIHDAKDDVLMIRLEGAIFVVEQQGQPDVVLEPKYQLGALSTCGSRPATAASPCGGTAHRNSTIRCRERDATSRLAATRSPTRAKATTPNLTARWQSTSCGCRPARHRPNEAWMQRTGGCAHLPQSLCHQRPMLQICPNSR
jgi:hypothetical protein